ncbi:hypothetical protein [Chryseobacterium echinoideorum]|uniref:hypothetical protein n=1 Tax=Chryseobacterium echinoideorum TaxID=1549648 RepID=UPI001184C611|nr:hypothetical protein [Chryseobacterium echinoideorum]
MKKIIISAIIFTISFSCSKKSSNENLNQQKDSLKISDSINIAKRNDSIRMLNSKNRFRDFSGNHRFTYETQAFNPISGTVTFDKIEGERDNYNLSGSIKSGENSVNIKGFVQVVSPKHMNFTGEIIQKISVNDNGKPYIRKGTKTFMSKNGGKTYRLQDMVNGSGFVDYIDIHF